MSKELDCDSDGDNKRIGKRQTYIIANQRVKHIRRRFRLGPLQCRNDSVGRRHVARATAIDANVLMAADDCTDCVRACAGRASGSAACAAGSPCRWRTRWPSCTAASRPRSSANGSAFWETAELFRLSGMRYCGGMAKNARRPPDPLFSMRATVSLNATTVRFAISRAACSSDALAPS